MSSVPVGSGRPTPALLLGDSQPGQQPLIDFTRARERIACAIPAAATMAELRLLAASRSGGAAVALMTDAQVLDALGSSAMTGQLSLSGGSALAEGGGSTISAAAAIAAAAAAGAAVGAVMGAAQLAAGGEATGDTPFSKAADPCGTKLQCVDLGEVLKQASTGRQSDPMDRFLEVVAPEAGTSINLMSVGSKCGKSPVWTISGLTNSQKTGANTTLRAERWLQRAVLGGHWAGNALPKTYDVSVATPCGFSGYTHQVRVYPTDELSITVNAADWTDVTEKVDYAIETLTSAYMKDAEFEKPNGKVTVSGRWEEEKGSHLAYYGWKVSTGFDPLLGGKFRAPFGPSAAVPQWLKRYGDAYLFFEASGGISLTGEWGRTGVRKVSSTLKISGSIEFKVGGSVFLMDESTLSIEVSGSTGLEAKATPDHESHDKPTIELNVELGGLTAEFSIEVAWGWVELKREATIFDTMPLMERSIVVPDSLSLLD